MSQPIKDQVKQQFAKNAEKYVTSSRHAAGEDLALLIAASGANPNITVLDIATGGGHVANALAPLVKRVTAYDLTEEMLKAAEGFIHGNGYSNVDFVRGDAEAIPFEDGSFDLVTCRIAAHHFPNVPAFLSEAYRVVKPGGKLQLIDNVVPEDQELGRFYNEVEKLRDPGHVRALPKSEWLRLLESTGFRVEAMICFVKPFEFSGWCERMSLTSEEKNQVRDRFLQASDSTRSFFQVSVEAGEVTGFTGEAAYFQAVKQELE
jgi:ubiquinone/menaquinone biosynthesis C-methylase UbiE